MNEIERIQSENNRNTAIISLTVRLWPAVWSSSGTLVPATDRRPWYATSSQSRECRRFLQSAFCRSSLQCMAFPASIASNASKIFVEHKTAHVRTTKCWGKCRRICPKAEPPPHLRSLIRTRRSYSECKSRPEEKKVINTGRNYSQIKTYAVWAWIGNGKNNEFFVHRRNAFPYSKQRRWLQNTWIFNHVSHDFDSDSNIQIQVHFLRKQARNWKLLTARCSVSKVFTLRMNSRQLSLCLHLFGSSSESVVKCDEFDGWKNLIKRLQLISCRSWISHNELELTTKCLAPHEALSWASCRWAA